MAAGRESCAIVGGRIWDETWRHINRMAGCVGVSSKPKASTLYSQQQSLESHGISMFILVTTALWLVCPVACSLRFNKMQSWFLFSRIFSFGKLQFASSCCLSFLSVLFEASPSHTWTSHPPSIYVLPLHVIWACTESAATSVSLGWISRIGRSMGWSGKMGSGWTSHMGY